MARRLLPLIGVLAFVSACSSSSDDEGGETPLTNCAPEDDTLAASRGACEFGPGALPKQTLSCKSQGQRLPFEHVVLIMQENRSFDHYFQKLPEYGQPDVDVAPEGTTQPAPDDSAVPYVHKSDYCFSDTNHEWGGSHESWNQGAMDGFAKANAKGLDPTGSRAIGYYDDTDIPFYYQLASTFATSDRYFCSVMGPTWPNRMYWLAATSFGNTENKPVLGQVPTLMGSLNDAGVTWREYRTNLAASGLLVNVALDNTDKIVDISEFAKDVAAGTLPQVSWVESLFSAGGAKEESEHPPGDMQVGQKWVYDQIKADHGQPLLGQDRDLHHL